jgi:hypothetical protein
MTLAAAAGPGKAGVDGRRISAWLHDRLYSAARRRQQCPPMMSGQKVVCVDDAFPLGIEEFYTALPKAGVTYVIRDVSLGVNFRGEEGEIAVTLVGLHNPKSSAPPFPERAFKAERFRPLEDDRLTEEALAERSDALV